MSWFQSLLFTNNQRIGWSCRQLLGRLWSLKWVFLLMTSAFSPIHYCWPILLKTSRTQCWLQSSVFPPTSHISSLGRKEPRMWSDQTEARHLPIFPKFLWPESEFTLFCLWLTLSIIRPCTPAQRPLAGLLACFPWPLSLLMERWLSVRSNWGFSNLKWGCEGWLWIDNHSSIFFYFCGWRHYDHHVLDFITQLHFMTTGPLNPSQCVRQCNQSEGFLNSSRTLYTWHIQIVSTRFVLNSFANI